MFSGTYKYIPTIIVAVYPFVFIVGVIYYFYVQVLLKKQFKFKWIHLLNIIPLVYGFYLIKGFLLEPFEKKLKILERGWFGGLERYFIDFVMFSIPNFITIIYIIVSLLFIIKYSKGLKNTFSNTDIEFLTWLKKFTFIYLILVIVDTLRLGLSIHLDWDLGEGEVITNLLIAVFIQYYIYQVIKNPTLVFHNLHVTEPIKTVKTIDIIKKEFFN